jgi:hypothetical protein
MIWRMQVRCFRYTFHYGEFYFIPRYERPAWLKRLQARQRHAQAVSK